MVKKNPSDQDIYKKINAKNPLAVTITRGKFEKGQNEMVDKVEWKEGVADLPPSGEKVTFVKIYKIIEPTPKQLNEIMGMATSDYQNYLEDSWIKTLKQKYPVNVNSTAINFLFR